jgi:dipeptidyl aminopeptidase/acylaminoacyl peptidase
MTAVAAALISIVVLAAGPRDGVLVWTGTATALGPARLVAQGTSPVLSPNGRLVAFVLRGELRVQPVAGGAARTLSQVPGAQRAIAFSPSGARIAFAADGAIISLPVTGKGPVRKVSLPTSWARSSFDALAWSSANAFAFSRTTSVNDRVCTVKNELDYVDAQGAARVLFHNRTPCSSKSLPVFSPDGSWIVVEAGEGRGLISVPTGLGRPLQLTTRRDSDPVWSPDGRVIAFMRDASAGGRCSDVWLVRADGTGLRRLTTSPEPPPGVPCNSQPLAWSPDGKQLLCFRHDRFAVVDVATRASRDLKPVGTQDSLLGARWA